MINWPIIPMVYNDSFTYMEWLGKLTYIADNHEVRIDDCEKNIIDLWAKVNDHETRITTLEDWREEVVDPFIEYATDKLNDHELRIIALEDDVTDLKDWREGTVDPFITAISDWKSGIVDPFISNITTWKDDVVDPHITSINNWKTNTVDPFITNTTTWKNNVVDPHISTIDNWKTNTVDPFIASTTDELIRLGANATAESSARRNADNELSSRITAVTNTASETQAKVNRLEIQMQNVGTVRYFLDTATVASDGAGGTNLSVVLPDEDWVTCDVRFLAGGTEYRVTGTISDTTLVSTADNGKTFGFTYDSTTRTVTVNVDSTVWAAADIKRFDYILYDGALTQAAQDQADIDFFNKMDANGDGMVDASDASSVLGYYADISTGVIPEGLSGQEAWTWYAQNVKTYLDPNAFPDFNGDGRIDASDASSLLGYYAYAATYSGLPLTGPQLMRQYRTEWEERHNA